MFDPAFRYSQQEIFKQGEEIVRSPFFSQLLQHIPLTIMIINQARQVVYVNNDLVLKAGVRQKKQLMGLRPGECLDCIYHAEGIFGCGSTSYCKVCGFADAVLQSEKNRPGKQECIIALKNGESLTINVHTKPFAYRGQQYTFCSIEDISDRKARQMLENIFVHDIRNTSTIISGLSEIFLDLPAGDVKKILNEVTQRLNEEINAYLMISSAENNTLGVKPSEVNISHLILEAVSSLMINPRFSKKTVDYNQEDFWLFTDKTLLRQVLINLIKNALEAGPANDTIAISQQNENAGIIISVKNKQLISAENQLHLFRKTFSTKGSGRGWGTYSIRLLTEKYLKGKVSFTSSPKQGTIFTIRIPSMHEPRAADQPRSTEVTTS